MSAASLVPPSLRIGFIIGSPSRLRREGLAMKRRKMKLSGVLYPDVYSIPDLLTGRFDFIRDGTDVPAGEYDFLLSELNRSSRQLEYLARLIRGGHRMAVIPGPPDLLGSVLDERMLHLARQVLNDAAAVWAYSEGIRTFADGLIGRPKAQVIPWPFDAEGVRRIGRVAPKSRGEIPILLQIPLRFDGVSQTFPFVLKAALTDALDTLGPTDRRRISFHTFVYTEADRKAIDTTGFAEGIPLTVERKRGYPGFVRLMGRCAGVVNLTAGDVLGRITFLAGALNRPGIFSDNTELNSLLYPGSLASPLDPGRLRHLLTELLQGAVERSPPAHLLPDAARVEQVGDLRASSVRLAEIVRQMGVR